MSQSPVPFWRQPSEVAPLFQAIEDKNDRLALGLATKTDPGARDAAGNSPLAVAAMQGNAELVAVLMERFDPKAANHKQETALMMAARAGFLDCVRILAPVSDASAVDHGQKTALMHAARRDKSQCVGVLLPISNPDAQDWRGATALMHAIDDGGVKSVKMLAAASNLAIADTDGNLALHIAARRSLTDCLNLILGENRPCGVNRRNNGQGLTPVMAAAQKGLWECVAALAPLSDLELVDDKGDTAWDLAFGRAWDINDRHGATLLALAPFLPPAQVPDALAQCQDSRLRPGLAPLMAELEALALKATVRDAERPWNQPARGTEAPHGLAPNGPAARRAASRI